jgi:hypothetical protein
MPRGMLGGTDAERLKEPQIHLGKVPSIRGEPLAHAYNPSYQFPSEKTANAPCVNDVLSSRSAAREKRAGISPFQYI